MKRKGVEKAEQRERIIADYKASGLSGAEYCRQKNLPANNFYYWLRRSGATSFVKKRAGFLRVHNTVVLSEKPVVIETPGGYRIEVRKGTSLEFSAEILRIAGMK